MEIIDLEIINWDCYQIRRDVKKCSWFRLDHDIFDQEQFWHFSREELCFFIYLLCTASKENSQKIKISINRAIVVGKFKKTDIFSAIKKLQQLQIVRVSVTDTLRERDANVTTYNSTLHYTTLHNTTLTSSGDDLHELAIIWNNTCKNLPKVREMNAKRKKLCKQAWDKNNDPSYWSSLIESLSTNSFCNGKNNSGWKANFDYFIKPDTRTKIIEGLYSNKKTKSQFVER